MKRYSILLISLLYACSTVVTSDVKGTLAPKPLYRDPIYDGAADPVVIWNPIIKKWWMFYTNRRATETQLPGVSWVFKTPIGIAESVDGANWSYVGTAVFPDLPQECGGENATLWAPDVIKGDDGLWHMFLSIQPGVAEKWGIIKGFIAHLTSKDLKEWKYDRRLDLPVSSYDADVVKGDDGKSRMYFRDPKSGSIKMVESKDLFNWSVPVEALKARGEGPIAFKWKGKNWLIIDDWKGLCVFYSRDGKSWEKQPGESLLPDGQGTGKDDIPNGLHGEIVISNDRLYLYYFTHPGRVGENVNKDTFEQRRSSIQVVELKLDAKGLITANRNEPTYVSLKP